jgi:hypothetical protein
VAAHSTDAGQLGTLGAHVNAQVRLDLTSEPCICSGLRCAALWLRLSCAWYVLVKWECFGRLTSICAWAQLWTRLAAYAAGLEGMHACDGKSKLV